jgi:hypothetical protein
MIPAPPGWAARYKHTAAGDGSTYWTEKRVIAWDDDGAPLVVDDETGRLIAASHWSNFDGVDQAHESPIVSVAPAGGWISEYTLDGKKYAAPLIGWGLRADGTVVPLETDGDGYVDVSRARKDTEIRIYHPDEQDEVAE